MAAFAACLWIAAAHSRAQSQPGTPAGELLVARAESLAAVTPGPPTFPAPPPSFVRASRLASAVPETAAAASPSRTASMPTLASWSSFEIKKTAVELAEGARLQDDGVPATRTRPSDVHLPPQRDTMRMSTAVGYLQGADWGGDFLGSGKFNGMQTDFSSFVTAGQSGFEGRSARVSVFAPDGRWHGEGGDMFSDLRGLARGARVSWHPGKRWTPSVAVYVRGPGAPDAAAVVSYRDRVQITEQVGLGAEVASDGAVFFQGQYARRALDFTTFFRDLPGVRGGRDTGVSGGVRLPRRIGLTGALRVSDATNDSRRWQLASIRLPLTPRATMTLERSWWTGSSGEGSINALILQVPLGPVHLVQRIQWGRTDYPQRAVPFGFDQRQMQSTASYTPGPWGNVMYQQSTQWLEDGRAQQWDEVSLGLQLGRRTSAYFVTAFPNVSEPERFRARITQKLSATLSLEGQYGRLSAFQNVTTFRAEQSRVMVTIRKDWLLHSPSRGGDVRGRAVDQSGDPVAGALVRLGPYSTITDDAGGYAFTRVPDGTLDLSLDRDKLPAAYGLAESPRPLDVTRKSRTIQDLEAIPLNAIRGRVYVDLNGDGDFDEGEGVPNVVIASEGVVTATTATGSYGFYNLPPGPYTIRIDVPRLAGGLAVVSPAELDVELMPDRPLLGVDFILERRDMPILMRALGR